MKIYYAHHQWKYGTEIEKYEIDLIRDNFSNAEIFNPSTDLIIKGKTNEEIMDECLEHVRESDVVIFSSVDGMIGIGVYTELKEARKCNKKIYYISHDTLWPSFHIRKCISPKSDRLYAYVKIPVC